jgi:hypothetical protein
VGEVVVAGMDDDAGPAGRRESAERGQIGDRQGIDQPRRVARGDLDQREPLRIVMEAVALGVERDLGGLAQALDQCGQRIRRLNPAGP